MLGTDGVSTHLWAQLLHCRVMCISYSGWQRGLKPAALEKPGLCETRWLDPDCLNASWALMSTELLFLSFLCRLILAFSQDCRPLRQNCQNKREHSFFFLKFSLACLLFTGGSDGFP